MNGEEQPFWVFRLTSGLAARLAPLSLILFVGSIAIYVAVARQTLQAAPIPYVATILTPFVVFVLHEALHGLGFEPEPASGRVLLHNCPFHALATQHTELVCGLNHAFLTGLLAGLPATGVHAELAPHPGRCCVELTG